MISKRDLQLGKIALRAGMITKDQLKGCLALQKKLIKTKGKKVALGALLLKKGYLTEEQLEEIVKQHNERAAAVSGDATASEVAELAGGASGDATGDDAEAGAEKRKKKKAASASRAGDDEGADPPTATATKARKGSAQVEAEAPAPEGDAAERKRQSREIKRSKDKDRAGGSSRAEHGGKNGAATADDEPKTETKRSKRLPPAEEEEPAEKPKKDSGKAKKDSGKAKKAAESDVDPAVFASAPDDAVDEDDRRLVACPECGKKYRIRQNQVGKRFGCRRCKNKVKVPKDLFTRPPEREKVAGGVEPEEFTLGSGDATGSDAGPALPAAKDGEAPKTSVRTAAARAAVAIQRVQAEPSIKDLAKAAQQHQRKGLPPRTRFGPKQALTLLASILALVGFVGGSIYLKQQATLAEERKKQERIDKEFEGWEVKVKAKLADVPDVLKREDSISLGSYRAELMAVIDKKVDLIEGSNSERADRFLEAQELGKLVRDLLIAQARNLIREGRPEEAIDLYKQAVKGSKDPELLLGYGRILVAARRFSEAAAVLEALAATSPAARALRGYAFERGDAGSKATKEYAELQDPLGPVLLARAHVVNRNYDQAIETVDKAGLTGQALAAGKVVVALALEHKGEVAAAESALKEAAAAAADTPFPKLALGELLLRAGKVQEALAALQEANGIKGTARGFLAMGEAVAAQLELERARTFFRDASAQPLVPEGTTLVAGELDPFEAPHALDPRALARCRLAAIEQAAGNGEAAALQYQEAERLDRFSPEVEAGIASIDLKAPYSEARLQRALKLLARVDGAESELVRSRGAARVLIVRGAFLVENGRHAEATEVLAAAVSIDPAVAPQADTLRGRSLEATSQHTRAYDAYADAARGEVLATVPGGREYAAASRRFEEKPGDAGEQARVLDGLTAALAHNPYHARARLLRARVLVKQGKTRPALSDLEQAIVLNKYLRDAYVTRGYLYVRDLPEREQTSETTSLAGADFETALKIELRQGGERPESHNGLALVFFLQNDLLQAHQHADKAIELAPNDPEGYRIRAMIRARQGNTAGAQADQKKLEALKSTPAPGR